MQPALMSIKRRSVLPDFPYYQSQIPFKVRLMIHTHTAVTATKVLLSLSIALNEKLKCHYSSHPPHCWERWPFVDNSPITRPVIMTINEAKWIPRLNVIALSNLTTPAAVRHEHTAPIRAHFVAIVIYQLVLYSEGQIENDGFCSNVSRLISQYERIVNDDMTMM